MRLGKLPSKGEIRVINPQSSRIVGRLTMRVRALFDSSVDGISHKLENVFGRKSSKTELIVVSNTQENPLEELMDRITKGIDTLPDESLIALARGLHSMFGNGVKRERKTRIDYINMVIMPLVGENEQLPTILISEPDKIIERFGILIKKKVIPIMQKKVAGLK